MESRDKESWEIWIEKFNRKEHIKTITEKKDFEAVLYIVETAYRYGFSDGINERKVMKILEN